jgi:hypothetical protein
MKRKDYQKPTMLVVEVKQQHHLMIGSPDPLSTTSDEILDDYNLNDPQTW